MLDLGFSGSIVSATYDTVLNFRHRLCRMRTQSPLLTLPSFSRTSFYLQKLPDDSVSNSDNWTCLKGLFFSEGYSFSLTVPSMVLKLLSLGSPRPAPHKPWASSLAGVPFSQIQASSLCRTAPFLWSRPSFPPNRSFSNPISILQHSSFSKACNASPQDGVPFPQPGISGCLWYHSVYPFRHRSFSSVPILSLVKLVYSLTLNPLLSFVSNASSSSKSQRNLYPTLVDSGVTKSPLLGIPSFHILPYKASSSRLP